MAAEGVAGGVDVVFEHVDRGVCAVGFAQLALGLQGQVAHHVFAGEVLGQGLARVARFGGGVFGVGSDVQIQT